MSEKIPSLEFEGKIRNAVTTSVPDPAFVNQLRSDLLKKASVMKQNSIEQNPRRISRRLAWSLALGLGVLVVGVLATSPRVAEAMKRLWGYLPGIGFVDQAAPLRILSEPVVVEREGITVTVEQGVVDAERTVLLINAGGFTPSDIQFEEIPACETRLPQLRLPDGTLLTVDGSDGDSQGDTGYFQRVWFSPLPAGVDDVTLEIPCLFQVVMGVWPRDWQIPLHFEPTDDLELAPVIEIPTSTATVPVQSETNQPTEGSSEQAGSYGISLALEQVVELEDGYILMGSLRWEDENIGDFGVFPHIVELKDANGQLIPLVEVPPERFPERGSKQILWAYQVTGKTFADPLTLTFDALKISLSSHTSFQFDPGPNPQPGQTWALGLDLPFGDDIIQVLSATLEQAGSDAVFQFAMQSSHPEVVGVSLADVGHSIGGGGGGDGGIPQPGPFNAPVWYQGGVPAGPLNLTIGVVRVLHYGPWEVTWTPTAE